jgi:hypothetical protein
MSFAVGYEYQGTYDLRSVIQHSSPQVSICRELSAMIFSRLEFDFTFDHVAVPLLQVRHLHSLTIGLS